MLSTTKDTIRRISNTVIKSPKTSLLCACKKLELRLLKTESSSYSYNKPISMDIELTNVCNLKCSWCDTQFYADKSTPVREISWIDFQQIAPKLEGLNRVIFCGGGETLTCKHAAESVALVKEYVPTVLMHSNGVLLHGKRAQKLAKSGLDNLRISIDGSDEETFRNIRGASLSKILDNLKYFSSISDTPISTVSVMSKNNWRSLLNIPEMLREVKNVRQLYFQPVEVEFLGWNRDDFFMSREELVEFRETISDKCKTYGLETNVDEADFDPLFFEPFSICEYPFFGYITLNYEGFVAPCCRLTNVAHMGDLKQQSFNDVWNGKHFRKLRELMISGNYPSYCHDRCKHRVKMNSRPSDDIPGKLKKRPSNTAQITEEKAATTNSIVNIDPIR